MSESIHSEADQKSIRYYLSWVLWPTLFSICMIITSYGFMLGHPHLYFNIAYLFLIISLFFLERFMPHEVDWQKSDGQLFADIAHTLTSKGTVQGLLLVNGVIGLSGAIEGGSGALLPLWPYGWPLAAQVVLAVVASEFMLYWAHRTSHEFMPLWRFHAVHHSVTKLWFANTGRFHFVDSLYSIVLGLIPLIILGAPMDMVKWVAVITAFIGMLTHCNVEMRFGILSWIFNTPALHRWHHSKDLREGNKNYGENVMIWDLLFKTYFNEDRRPPIDIGISEYMPLTFQEQIIWPFLTNKKRACIHKKYNIKQIDRSNKSLSVVKYVVV